MTTETYLDLSYERGKGSKRHHRPKILKLSDVTIPHRSRKKSKVKTKDRSAILVRERIYDDPAYTEDISHLANPIRRGSVPGKHSAEHKSKSDISGQTASASSLLSRHQLTKDPHQYVSAKQSKYKGANSAGAPSGSTAVNVSYNCGSSSSDNATLEPTKSSSMTRRVRSLERSLAKERTDKKATQKRNSKQKRNLSLDNSRNLLPGHSQHAAQAIKQGYDFETRARRTPSRKKYTESSVEAAQTEASELDDAYSVRSSAKDSTATVPVETNAIGKRFLRGEIGIKSFNYYLLKEGLKSSKKLTGKQRSTLHSEEAYSKSEKMHSRSEENIYEEIFFKDTPSTATTSTTALATTSTPPQPLGKEAHNHPQQVQKGVEQVLPRVMSGPSGESDVGVFADCELCMEQCSKDSCEYCLDQAVQGARKNQAQPQKQTPQQEPFINQGYHGENSDPQGTLSRGTDPVGLPAAHILEFQSYNPNNPGVYKIETTPVAITGDYNPILQFQQSSATTSTSTTTTPGDQQQHIQPHQLQQPIYGGYYHPLPHQKPLHTTIVGNPLTRQYAVSGSLLLAQVAGPGSAPPRRPQQQQHYIVSYQNGGPVAGGASLQRLNTKSSSSSDSLPHHKYNTMTRMEANVFSAPSTGDLCYAVGGTAPLHPLMYAASRPIGGSQILIDPYDPPQMYKSDSKASILSEFSLRSSDNSQRYGPHRRHGGGRVSDSSIFSIYSNSGQRRYFGSSESRFGYDCRRCSLDGIIGMGSGTAMGATTAPSDKCSYSDNCRYECRNCDCSSNYFSSDFDDLYGSIARGGSSGIPRKTAAGTLPSSSQGASTDLKEKPPPPSLLQQQFSAPLDFKQNKYAQDFFKHVNDVKRSIYQSEMQRNNSFESSRRGPRAGGNNTNTRSSPKRAVSQEPILEPVVSTLPLSRGRPAAGVRPTPAPRTSLQSQPALPATSTPRDPTPTKRRAQPSGRREYPSLDRLVASNTGTIPKRHSRTMEETESLNPKFTSKPKESDAKDSMTGSNSEEQFTPGKRHHRSSGTKSHQNVPGPSTRRKDIPAPPPPSPATYSDLQELKANMEGLQDDTNSRSLESETSESPAVANPSVRSPTGSHNDKKTTRQLAPVQSARSVAPFKITIALTDMDIQAEFSTKSPPTVSISGHLDTGPNTGPDIGLLEQEDADVFYDARSEDSGAGILPTETCPPLAKGASGMVTCSQEAADGKMATENSKETNYSGMENSSKDVNTFLRTHPIAAGLEQTSNISGIQQGNDIGMASDDADSLKQGGGRVQEQITPYDVENQVGLNTGLQSHQWRSESEMTEVTLKGKCAEKTSKTIDDEETPTSAIDQHAAATCLEGQHTSLPATTIFHGVSTITNAGNISSNNTPAHSTRASSTDVDVYVEFSCTTANTDSPTLTHSDRNFLDIPLLQIAAGTPAQSRPLTRQDFACLDSSEAQSDDSHLTRDSVTRESQNDELSSSTLEKLDVSTLPLPAIPKRRRPRSRASPSKNLQHRQRHEAVDNANAVDTSPASSQQQHLKPRQRAYTPDIQKSEISTPKNNAANQKPQQHLSAFQQYVVKRRESLEASNRSFNEKLEARRMHGANSGVPTYLFGEHFQAGGVGGPGSGRKSLSPATNKEEIYLNKSGWVQVNTKRGGFKEDSFGGYRRQQNGGTASILQDNGRSRAAERYSLINQHQQQQSNFSIAEPKFVGSKVEELIQRNEARLGGFSSRDPALRPGYRIIDPQLASILNDRPGFLPVKSPNDLDSPITPILSPPPAFQDNSRTPRQVDRRKSSRQQAPLPLPMQLQSEAQQSPQHLANGTVKGMVFSRSFEYDARRPTPINSYVETFSRSFDGNLSERPLQLGMPLVGQRERSPNFSTLTGNSPNYLTKRESGGGSSGSLRSRDSSPKFLSPQTTTAYLNASVKEAPPAYNMSGGGGQQAKYSPRSRLEQTSDRSKIHALGRSRKSQFNRMGSAGPPAAPPSSLGMGVSRFRSFDTTKSQRLNSCDSGARSDLSNDELDNEDGFLSEFLSDGSQKFQKLCSSSVSISPFKMQRQRSLTPERNESHSSSSSLRKQRSLTPESRSLTPEERRKKGSQHSLLGSRQNSGTRSNTLEARPRHGDKTPPNISRSSSSSSYSGGELCSIPVSASGPTNHRRAMAAAHSAAKQAEQEHRIRRSRSLQLSERSPNRAHKSIVNVGISAKQSQQQPQQTPAASYRSSSNSLHQPPRQTGSPQSYGTRLCDHELTYEMLRKSPIMNFRRGDSSDYELPVLLRNRETINSGGNSELNFMSNETRIYEHPTTVLKPQRSLRQSPASRDDIPLEVAVGVGGDYIYRQAPSQPQSSSATSQSLTSTTTKSCSKTLNTGDYWPRCGACQEKAAPGAIQRQYSLSVVTKVDQEPEFRPHVTTVAVNDNITNVEAKAEKLPLPQWTFLCSGVANCRPKEQTTMTTNASERRQLMAVVRPRVVPLAPTSLVLMGTGDVYVAKAAEGENKSCPQLLAEVEIGLSSSQGKQDEFNDVNNNCRRRKRSSSLPRLKPRRYTETVERLM